MEKPQFFISCVSHEFRQIRARVSKILETRGFLPSFQENFETQPGDLRRILEGKIDACLALIHIVGHAYGLEAQIEVADHDRISYTQYEFLYAQKKKKKTWLVFAGDGCTRDTPTEKLDLPDDPGHPDPTAYQAERRSLQLTYQNKWKAGDHIYYSPKDDEELEHLVEVLDGSELWKSVCWEAIKEGCDSGKNETAKLSLSKFAGENYYQARAIEKTFDEFVHQRPERAMIIVGKSGMGKTTLLIHLVSACLDKENPCRMFSSAGLTKQALQDQLAEGLNIKKLTIGMASESYWEKIDAEAERLFVGMKQSYALQ